MSREHALGSGRWDSCPSLWRPASHHEHGDEGFRPLPSLGGLCLVHRSCDGNGTLRRMSVLLPPTLTQAVDHLLSLSLTFSWMGGMDDWSEQIRRKCSLSKASWCTISEWPECLLFTSSEDILTAASTSQESSYTQCSGPFSHVKDKKEKNVSSSIVAFYIPSPFRVLHLSVPPVVILGYALSAPSMSSERERTEGYEGPTHPSADSFIRSFDHSWIS